MGAGIDREHWQREAELDAMLWSSPDACPACGQWVGHFGGDAERDPCPCIPQDVPLVELRPNCYGVRRMRIGWAIRKACKS